MSIPDILSFKDDFEWLSNFWPCIVTYEGMAFRSVEHAYVAAKTMDLGVRKKIQAIYRPGECKRFGRSISIRSDWDNIRLGIMLDLVRQKFSIDHTLRQKLLDTGQAKLIEGNTWKDTFWGVYRGRGSNHLGNILMHVRDELTQGRVLPYSGDQLDMFMQFR